MNALRAINLGVRFLLELGALAAVFYWGMAAPGGRVLRVALAIGATALVVLLWGTFISPKARFSTGLYGRAILGFIVFSIAAAALYVRGQTGLAIVYGALALVSSVLLALLGE